MPEWQLRQKHHDDVREALAAAGCVFADNGMLLKWNGTRAQEELTERGHSSTAFDSCLCNNKTGFKCLENY